MKLTSEILDDISKQHGDSFYLLDTKQFENNFKELQKAFRDIYPNSHIAYSYKTNYIPRLCEIVNYLGGYAEVVSSMEYKIACEVGVKLDKIIFNGPYKSRDVVEKLLFNGGIVNIDSLYEMEIIKDIAESNKDKKINIGLRCNFDINDNVISRFGFDVDGEEFTYVMKTIEKTGNLHLKGLHCHFADRYLKTWINRVDKMLELVNKHFINPPEYIDFGGGLFGKMKDSLKLQFNSKIPCYQEYAQIIAKKFNSFYKNEKICPKLFIEPGSALVGDSMQFVSKVINIKDIRGKKIATLSGSIYNINPTLNKKNPPISIYHSNLNLNNQIEYTDLEFAGFTCIESDYLYKGFDGEVAVGDYVVFENVGSYSIVLKPPFILPNFPILSYNESFEIIKRQETFDDLFHTFRFN